jgi:hypothetical protein
MLPKETIDLLAGFVRAFDSERPAPVEFRKAHHQVAASLAQRGLGWGSSAIITIGKSVTAYLEERARFVWTKLKEVVCATDVEPYSDLGSDLKAQIAAFYTPTRQAAERYMGELRQAAQAPSGYTVETERASANILLKINAEVDLFCASYAARKKQQTQGGGPTFNNFMGVYGNVTNSQVTLYDFGLVYQVLKEHGIKREDRNELEDIMDALKTAPPTNKSSWIARGEKWLVKHKEALGAGAEIIGKALGAGTQHPPKC